MNIIYKLPFSKYVKKARKPLQLAIEDSIEVICDEPDIGEKKVGDLDGIRVYKFRFNRQEYLIAYQLFLSDIDERQLNISILSIDFYQVGTHENFYNSLKRYLRKELRT